MTWSCGLADALDRLALVRGAPASRRLNVSSKRLFSRKMLSMVASSRSEQRVPREAHLHAEGVLDLAGRRRPARAPGPGGGCAGPRSRSTGGHDPHRDEEHGDQEERPEQLGVNRRADPGDAAHQAAERRVGEEEARDPLAQASGRHPRRERWDAAGRSVSCGRMRCGEGRRDATRMTPAGQLRPPDGGALGALRGAGTKRGEANWSSARRPLTGRGWRTIIPPSRPDGGPGAGLARAAPPQGRGGAAFMTTEATPSAPSSTVPSRTPEAAAVAGGTAAVGFPAVLRAQAPDQVARPDRRLRRHRGLPAVPEVLRERQGPVRGEARSSSPFRRARSSGPSRCSTP